MAEGARLESVFTGNRNVGSNPTPSASFEFTPFRQCFQGFIDMLWCELVTGLSYIQSG